MRVVCVKVGKEKYTAQDVNCLAAMVRRHTTLPVEFLCFTDDPCDLNVPSAPLPDPEFGGGWWHKLSLFRQHTERYVYFDLDTLIVGNIDALLAYQGHMAILRDFLRPTGCQSAVMSLAAGVYEHIYHQFQRT